VGTVLKKMDVVLFLLAAFLMAFAHSTYGSYYSLLLTNFGYESHTIGWLFAIGVISEIGVFIYMPTIMRYFSLKQILIFSFICAIVRYLLIGTFVSSLPILIFAQLLHGATFGAYHASAINLISRIFPVTDNAKGQAILTIFSSGLGGVLGSLVAGGIWQIYGGKIVFLILSLIACCGTIIMFFAFKGQHVSRSASLH
jgi:PPP family 3-phenylpropionic acid transporter